MQTVLLSLALFAAAFCGAALLALRLWPNRARQRLRRLGARAELLTARPGALRASAASRETLAGLRRHCFGARWRRALAREFPQALDLLVLCLEAGLALEAALARVCMELERIAPAMTRELSRATLELRAGAGKESALRG